MRTNQHSAVTYQVVECSSNSTSTDRLPSMWFEGSRAKGMISWSTGVQGVLHFACIAHILSTRHNTQAHHQAAYWNPRVMNTRTQWKSDIKMPHTLSSLLNPHSRDQVICAETIETRQSTQMTTKLTTEESRAMYKSGIQAIRCSYLCIPVRNIFRLRLLRRS